MRSHFVIFAVLAAAMSTLQVAAQSSKEDVRDYPPDLTETYRAGVPEDFGPEPRDAGAPALSVSEWDVVVSNTDPSLKTTNTTANSEPSIAIDPQNTNNIAILAFSGGWGANAPIWYSTNGGSLWTLEKTIPNPPGLSENCPCDQTPDWAANGNLSATFLHNDSLGIDVYSSTTIDPSVSADWNWLVSGGITQTTNQVDLGGPDQPWLLVAEDPVKHSQRNVYVGYDDLSTDHVRVAVAPGSDPPDFTEDHLVGNSGGAINPGHRLAKDLLNRKLYSLWQLCPSSDPNCISGADPKTIDYYLNCSADGGKTWNLNGSSTGFVVASGQSSQPRPKFGTVNALLGGVDHVTVDPNNGDVYVVWGFRDVVTGNNRLMLTHLVYAGGSGCGFLAIVGNAFVTDNVQAALPSVAVAKNSTGTVGVLYDRYDGLDPNSGLPKFSAWLATSDDHGITFSKTLLESFLSTTKDNGNPRQRVLGDYQQLKSWNNTFYGVFAGNGIKFGRPFANIDPIFFKTTVQQ